MSCCGQKRQQWQQQISYQEPQQAQPELILENTVPLQFNGTSSIMIKGPKTGYLYLFAPKETGLLVDGRDAPLILEGSQNFSLAK